MAWDMAIYDIKSQNSQKQNETGIGTLSISAKSMISLLMLLSYSLVLLIGIQTLVRA